MSNLETIYLRAPRRLQTVLLNAEALRIGLHRYGRPFRVSVQDMREREEWSPEGLHAYQDERLRSIVQYAYDHTAFYRRRLAKAGVDPAKFRGRDDLTKLPLVTKEDIRHGGAEFVSLGGPRRGWLEGHTSGTTGSPLALWYDRETCVLTNAVDRRHKVWVGMRENDWIGLLLGRLIVPPDQAAPPFWRANYVQRQLWLSSFHMSPENLGSYVKEIRRRGLRFLEGYPSTLFVLGKYLLDTDDSLPLAGAITSSETLHPVQRQVIETAFECELFDFYAHAERVIYAGECEHHAGKHIAEDYGYAELVSADGDPVEQGGRGYLVGTSLSNRAMPLIRYRTDDVSEFLPGTCACGRPFRRIADVTTKAEDLVITPDGRVISPSILTHPFKPLHGVVKSQIVQTSLDELIVKIVPGTDFEPEDDRRLRQALQDRIGSRVSVDIRIVDEIPREPSGKYRWVISKLDHDLKLEWE